MYHYHIDHLSRIYLSVFYLPITYISNFETQYLMCVKAACELLRAPHCGFIGETIHFISHDRFCSICVRVLEPSLYVCLASHNAKPITIHHHYVASQHVRTPRKAWGRRPALRAQGLGTRWASHVHASQDGWG